MSLLSDLGATANPFGTPSQGKWNLSRGTFFNANGDAVVFFYESMIDEDPTQRTALDQTADGGGRRLAVYKYPYKDGQEVRDLGREGYNFQFNIKFFGTNYQSIFADFVNTVQVAGQGKLLHPTLSPVFGSFTVRFKDFEFLHRYDEFNAITIKAVFIEDTTNALSATAQSQDVSPDSAIRQGLQNLVSAQAAISGAISDVSAILLLPAAISSAISQRLSSITGQISRLFGQLGATFSSDQTLQLLGQAALSAGGSVIGLSSGSVTASTAGGAPALQSLPPIYQAGYDPTTQTAIQAQLANFVSANQVTPTQAVFGANQARTAISAAIAEIEAQMGTFGYAIVVQYRALAITIQEAVEAAISTSQSKVILYTVPNTMSMRVVAKNCNLDPDRQNDIEALNPQIGSLNVIQAGTVLTVPAS